jgi:hypothetical protein
MRCWPTSRRSSILNMAHAGQFDRKSTASFRSRAERTRLRSTVGRPATGSAAYVGRNEYMGPCRVTRLPALVPAAPRIRPTAGRLKPNATTVYAAGLSGQGLAYRYPAGPKDHKRHHQVAAHGMSTDERPHAGPKPPTSRQVRGAIPAVMRLPLEVERR